MPTDSSAANDQGSSGPPEIAGRWRTTAVLKRDVFSTIERGFFQGDAGEVPAVVRHIDEVPWWSLPLAKHFLRREARGLAAAEPTHAAARPLYIGRSVLVRSWLDGLPLQIARPKDDLAFFRSAKEALRILKRQGVVHNDLAKEQNWLRGADGKAYLLDFQLAVCFHRRGRIFRMAAAEDLRHLLKHKRKYAASALTSAERRFLLRKSIVNRIWMATGKRVYRLITRGVFNYSDREGGGPRLVFDAPILVDRLKQLPGVRDAAIVAYPDRRRGVGLYAFVESLASPEALKAGLAALGSSPRPPELLQLVQSLPRNAAGEIRSEILQLIATNQLDQMGQLVSGPEEAGSVQRIVDGRLNLRDRHAF